MAIIILILQMVKMKHKELNKFPEITQILNGRTWTVLFHNPVLTKKALQFLPSSSSYMQWLLGVKHYTRSSACFIIADAPKVARGNNIIPSIWMQEMKHKEVSIAFLSGGNSGFEPS